MDGTAADREGGPKVSKAQEKRNEELAAGLDPDRSEKDALAHRGGPLLKVAEDRGADEGIVIDSIEEVA
jgi:hypothetical protein